MLKRLAVLIVFVAGPLLGQGAPSLSPAANPLAPIAWMAGGTWHGEVNGANGKLTKIDTRIERELGGRAFSFSTNFDGVMQY
jgi:hypothetical protein